MAPQYPHKQPADDMSNVWIYSFCPGVGVRAQYRLPQAVVDQANDAALKGDQLLNGVLTIINQFDIARGKNLTQGHVDTLLSGATLYARSTSLWAAMPPQESVASIHLVVVDWIAACGPSVLKVFGANGDSPQPLLPQTVEQVALAGIANHVRRNPADAQAEWATGMSMATELGTHTRH